MNILALNPGGNSLKAELVACGPKQRHAFEGSELLSVSVEDIGKDPKFLRYEGKKITDSFPVDAATYEHAARAILDWIAGGHGQIPSLQQIACVGIRVVHGGPDLARPTQIDADVERQIVDLERLAPLHNKSSIEILGPLREKLNNTPIYGVFDTAFHRTIPDYASFYGIPLELSRAHEIRRYGFHGISHRYLLERYAYLVNKPVSDCNLVSMHLESGCSVTAIRQGQSIDNTMGLTPLEGLMMGTRSGDLDPSIIPLLVRQEGINLDEVMTILNKKSGLLGVSGVSLDTRVLMKKYDADPRVKLAMEMFSYRVLKAVGAYLAVVGSPEAVVFGGGIAENTKLVRERVAEGLLAFGLEIDRDANERLIDTEGRLSTERSSLQAWVITAQEGLQIAHECCEAFTREFGGE